MLTHEHSCKAGTDSYSWVKPYSCPPLILLLFHQMVLQAGHYDPEAIRSCAEKVAVHWQQLMLKMEDRLKLVNASVAFYKTSEQANTLYYAMHPSYFSFEEKVLL